MLEKRIQDTDVKMSAKFKVRKPVQWLERYKMATGAGNIRLKRDLTRLRAKEPSKPDPIMKLQNKLKENLTEEIPEKDEIKRRFGIIGSVVIGVIVTLYASFRFSANNKASVTSSSENLLN